MCFLCMKNDDYSIDHLAFELKKAKKSAMEVFPKMSLNAGNAGRIPVKMIHQKSEDYTLDQNSILVLEKRAQFFAETISATTYAKIRKTVEQGLNDGKGRDDIAKLLRSVFIDMSKGRAKMIAQTEGTVVSNLGIQASFDQSDVVTGKKWLSAKDEKVRPSHQTNDNEIVSKDDAFSSGEHYPGEHSINCRCVIAPIIK